MTSQHSLCVKLPTIMKMYTNQSYQEYQWQYKLNKITMRTTLLLFKIAWIHLQFMSQ